MGCAASREDVEPTAQAEQSTEERHLRSFTGVLDVSTLQFYSTDNSPAAVTTEASSDELRALAAKRLQKRAASPNGKSTSRPRNPLRPAITDPGQSQSPRSAPLSPLDLPSTSMQWSRSNSTSLQPAASYRSASSRRAVAEYTSSESFDLSLTSRKWDGPGNAAKHATRTRSARAERRVHFHSSVDGLNSTLHIDGVSAASEERFEDLVAAMVDEDPIIIEQPNLNSDRDVCFLGPPTVPLTCSLMMIA